ncbi:hypothetical protein [Glaciecola sp. MH2013]|nr:hypothetical protein [Glaciecola sp. MH2013]
MHFKRNILLILASASIILAAILLSTNASENGEDALPQIQQFTSS